MAQERQDRSALRSVIRARPRSSALAAVALSLLFATLATPVIMADSWAISPAALQAGEPAPYTVRTPQFSGYGDGARAILLTGGPIVVARGEVLSDETAAAARAVAESRPSGPAAWGAHFAIVFLLGLVYTSRLNRAHRINLVRTQVVTLLLLVGVAATVKIALMATPMSSLLVPVAAAAILGVLVLDFGTGLTTALVAAVLISLLSPFDPGVVAVLTAQGVAAVLIVRENERRKRRILLGAAAGGVAAAATYGACYYLAFHALPTGELADPLRSAWLAAACGGLLAGVAAIPAKPLYQYLLGDINKNKLVELGDLSHPLLKQIAAQAPGTWQHSLAMANMAEVAANAIGADGRLVRVGAYYHDLGKALQPEYYVENLTPGETSPHDKLAPEVSCDAIFSHVTEGVRLARKHKLPERIIDFIHMHHGDGLLEYFWARCKSQGNPSGLVEADFRYPGVKPQSRETAILAICDAVEAASRTLKSPDDRAIQNLVQRIVYGKLHLGQLDESGLSVADLRVISNSLMETIKHAHHGRIEYPWQEEERRDAARREQITPPDGHAGDRRSAVFADEAVLTTTQRLAETPRLDSLDLPRPLARAKPSTSLEMAPTEQASAREDAASRGGAGAGEELSAGAAATTHREEDGAGMSRAAGSASSIEATVPALAKLISRPPSQAEQNGERDGDAEVAAAKAPTGSAYRALSPGQLVLGPPPKSRMTGPPRRQDEGDDAGKRPTRRR
jgi:cyclic-di-AMP phosphodiesterase PgpH